MAHRACSTSIVRYFSKVLGSVDSPAVSCSPTPRPVQTYPWSSVHCTALAKSLPGGASHRACIQGAAHSAKAMRHSCAHNRHPCHRSDRMGGWVGGGAPSRSHLRPKVPQAHHVSPGAIFNQRTPAPSCDSGRHRSGHQGARWGGGAPGNSPLRWAGTAPSDNGPSHLGRFGPYLHGAPTASHRAPHNRMQDGQTHRLAAGEQRQAVGAGEWGAG